MALHTVASHLMLLDMTSLSPNPPGDQRAALSIGVLRETAPGERRVAVDPDVVAEFARYGHRVLLESGAAEQAGWADAAYSAVGATIASRGEVIERADVLAALRLPRRTSRRPCAKARVSSASSIRCRTST